MSLLVPPSIKSNTSNISIVVGAELRIKVIISGIPSPNISVYKKYDDKSSTAILHSAELFIQSVDVSDEGEYVFVAVNNAGRTEKKVFLTVLGSMIECF